MSHTPSLRTQILGAVAGTGIALSLYMVYGWVSEPLTAALQSVFGKTEAREMEYTDSDRLKKQNEIAGVARHLLKQAMDNTQGK